MPFKPFALVGGMGCGKITAMEFFANEGFDIVNSDKLLHTLYEESHPQFKELAHQLDIFLGTSFVNDKAISRLILREKIGFDKSKLQKMVEITRPFILGEIKKTCQNLALPIVEFPLLFEMNARDEFSKIVCVSCSEETQLKRIKSRNPLITGEVIKSMLEVQKNNSFKEQNSDYVINNEQQDESYEFLLRQVKTVVHKLKHKVHHKRIVIK